MRYALIGAAALAALAQPAAAGPCTGDINAMQTEIDAKLNAAAARGKAAPQSTAAQLHRQPTPNSIASAEAQVGDIPEKDVVALRQFLDQARRADDSGDLGACRKALADARKLGGL
jgi:negative regulator of sigma E activity